ncbi:toll/interleukin-1 receptor domain-containing protein [Bradyrhizobium sp. LMG 9283]|uniref:toll/interleukin-1 receptor domain-containing protein n=1 Tax=Bradyrhizobium sp. LMG 9283 TaxID=592064 RepID=UPI00388FD3BE
MAKAGKQKSTTVGKRKSANSGRTRRAKAARPEQISVFISYVSEDRELAASFEAELLQLFAVAASLPPVKVFRDVGSIGKGSDYRTVITNALDEADILLVILTDRLKPSFAFPGFEVGYFARSLEERPKIYGNIPRRILPISIGAANQTTLDYLQAIKIDEDHIFKVPGMSAYAPGASTAESSANPVFALLADISATADAVLGRHGGASGGVSKQDELWRQKLVSSAARLHSCIQMYLESRVSSETYPERKIILHSDAPPVIGPDGVELSKFKIEMVGNSFQVFGFPEEKNRFFGWNAFINRMPVEMSGTWAEGIRTLATNALQGGDENYLVVATSKGDHAYRLFVSRVVTYVSKKTEIHIYIVKMIVRHYGDPLTSRLLSAINIGLEFRFLFLERSSQYRPARFDFPLAPDTSKEMDAWKSAVTQLLSHLNMILREAQDQHLMDADLLDKIWGVGGGPRVRQMMTAWESARTKLLSAAQKLLASNASDFPDTQEPFRIALRELHATTESMNREYTLRALQAIAEEVEELPPQTQSPPRAA